jgi:hypothetical protein
MIKNNRSIYCQRFANVFADVADVVAGVVAVAADVVAIAVVAAACDVFHVSDTACASRATDAHAAAAAGANLIC